MTQGRQALGARGERLAARWYADNRWWWEPLLDAGWRAYYEQLYGARLRGASEA